MAVVHFHHEMLRRERQDLQPHSQAAPAQVFLTAFPDDAGSEPYLECYLGAVLVLVPASALVDCTL